MAYKPQFKEYLKQVDDLYLSKTRKRINAKDPKKRVYGVSEQEEMTDQQNVEDMDTDDLYDVDSDELTDDTEDQETDEDTDEDIEGEEPQDPNKQGLIRNIENAHLVYKRQTEDGNYEELWIFSIGDNMKDGLEIQRNILAGTDILPKKTKSADGEQSYTLTTMGNAQLLHIVGLPN